MYNKQLIFDNHGLIRKPQRKDLAKEVGKRVSYIDIPARREMKENGGMPRYKSIIVSGNIYFYFLDSIIDKTISCHIQ